MKQNATRKSKRLDYEDEVVAKRKCKDHFLYSPDGLVFRIFDPVIMVFIIYSCFSSGYFIVFE